MNPAAVVAQANLLPRISPAALKLMGLLDRHDTCNTDIVNILKYDSMLTGNLLRLCNSPFVGLRMPVTSVDQAVLVLGHRQILRVVLALAFNDSMSRPASGLAEEPKALWRHSLVTALAAEVLTENAFTFELDPSIAFTSGLLHDIGKLLLEQVLTPHQETEIRARMLGDQLPRFSAERAVLETDHAEVGGCLLRHWKLPEVIAEAVDNHHRPAFKPSPRLSAVIHVANWLAHRTGSAPGPDTPAAQADPEVVLALGVQPERLEGLLSRIEDSARQVERLTEGS
jgi:putative nucleotidyltransferase with HDIG domain